MACEWCDDHIPWRTILEKATSLVFFTPHRAGRLTPSRIGSGSTRLWLAGEFTAQPGVKISDSCKNITSVKQILTRNRDRATKCHVQFVAEREYLLSGACEGSIFFIDPCGVKFDLGG